MIHISVKKKKKEKNYISCSPLHFFWVIPIYVPNPKPCVDASPGMGSGSIEPDSKQEAAFF